MNVTMPMLQINGKLMTRNSIYALASYGVNRLQILIVDFINVFVNVKIC